MNTTTQYYVKLRGKIRGPFSIQQLRRMTARGQFSRSHQVSIDDKLTWNSAEELLTTFMEEKKAVKNSSDIQFSPPDKGNSQSEANVEWHYVFEEQNLGPVTELELVKQIHLQNIKPKTLLWNRQMSDWTEASDIFPSIFNVKSKSEKKSKVFLWSALALLFIAMLTVGSLYTIFPLGQDKVVQSPDQAIETKSTGLVFFYLKIKLKTGEVSELGINTGTCFVVSRDGSALTNRHVIKDFQLWSNADAEGKIQRLIDFHGINSPELLKKNPKLHEIIMEKIQNIAEISPELNVYFGEKKYSSSLEYVSKKYDMAVMKIKDFEGESYFTLSAENESPQLTKVVALGFPAASQRAISEAEQLIANAKKDRSLDEILFGTSSHFDTMKESALEVNATAGEVNVIQQEAGGIYNIQHDATIRSGNSGGPLVLQEGDKAGVVFAINTLRTFDDSPIYISFPVAQMREELEDKADLKDLTWR